MTLTTPNDDVVVGAGPTTPVPPGTAAARAARQDPFRRWVRRAAAGDVVAALAAAGIAHLIRFGFGLESDQTGISYVEVGLLVALCWPLVMAVSGSYELRPSMFLSLIHI